jgi:hypothetical protein
VVPPRARLRTHRVFSAGPGNWPWRLGLRVEQRLKRAAQRPVNITRRLCVVALHARRYPTTHNRALCLAPGPASATLRAIALRSLQRTFGGARLACGLHRASQVLAAPTSRARRPRAATWGGGPLVQARAIARAELRSSRTSAHQSDCQCSHDSRGQCRTYKYSEANAGDH